MASQTVASSIFKENYRFLQQYVYSRVGIVLEDDKHYLFESRLAPIVKELGLASINDLCVFLHKERDAKVAQQVDEAMTTNETEAGTAGCQGPSLLVCCILHRAGSLQPGHAASGGRIRR